MEWSLIPQVFYDAIVRIVPGFVSIFAWYLTILGPSQAVHNLTDTDQNIFGLGAVTWLAALSYVLGFILKELWYLTFNKLKQKATEKSAIDEYKEHRGCLGKSVSDLEGQDLPDAHVMHDYVRIYLPSEGARLLKLRAERNLCRTLFTGLFLLPVVNILHIAPDWHLNCKPLTPDRVFLEIAMIAALIVLWKANSKLGQLYARRTCRSWLSLCFPVGPLEQKLAGKNEPENIQIKHLTFHK